MPPTSPPTPTLPPPTPTPTLMPPPPPHRRTGARRRGTRTRRGGASTCPQLWGQERGRQGAGGRGCQKGCWQGLRLMPIKLVCLNLIRHDTRQQPVPAYTALQASKPCQSKSWILYVPGSAMYVPSSACAVYVPGSAKSVQFMKCM
jgi:hypothetical protein